MVKRVKFIWCIRILQQTPTRFWIALLQMQKQMQKVERGKKKNNDYIIQSWVFVLDILHIISYLVLFIISLSSSCEHLSIYHMNKENKERKEFSGAISVIIIIILTGLSQHRNEQECCSL